MAKKPIQVVYNNKPDPVVKITEYEYTGDGLKQVKVRVGHNLLSKEHLNKSEEELGESISDIQKRVSDRVGKVYDPRTDQYVSIKTKEVK